jgi:PAS domain S-box-containing protein
MQLLRYSNEPATISSIHNQKLIEINDAFLARTGYRREEVIGRSCQELGLWEQDSVAGSIAEELAATGLVRCRTVRYRTKHGELRVGDFSAAIQHLGGAPSVVSFITDVTDAFLAQEEQRRSERRFRAYVEHAPDGLAVAGPDCRITFAAPSIERLLGFTIDEILGKDYRDFIHPRDLAGAAAAMEVLTISARPQPLELRVRHRSGRWICIEGTITSLSATQDDPPQTVFNWRDVTERKEDEERLRTVEGRLREIISHSPTVVTEFNADGVVVMAEGHGSGASLVGRRIFELFVDAPEVLETTERILRGETVNARLELQGRWFDVWGRPVRADDGSIAGGISVNTDITHRVWAEQRLELEQEQFRILVDNAPDLILVLDRQGRILFAGPSIERHLGYPARELIGAGLCDHVVVEDRDHLAASLEKALAESDAGLSVRFKLQIREGDPRTYEATGKVLPGRPARLLMQGRDITDQERYEVELSRARDAALESSRLKSTFLANMSHEVRSPLNVILGYVDVIRDHFHDIGDDSQLEFLDAMSRSGKRLLRTINSLLDYSKIETGGFQWNAEILAPAELAAGQVDEFRVIATRKGVDLKFVDEAPDARIFADEYCISSALHNLISNALKFTEHGSIEVRLFRCEGELRLEVRDSGIGIEEQFLPKLFQPFVQEDSSFNRKFEGSGLGLALTRRFLEANHARISVASEKGAGAAFTIHFREYPGRQADRFDDDSRAQLTQRNGMNHPS